MLWVSKTYDEKLDFVENATGSEYLHVLCISKKLANIGHLDYI